MEQRWAASSSERYDACSTNSPAFSAPPPEETGIEALKAEQRKLTIKHVVEWPNNTSNLNGCIQFFTNYRQFDLYIREFWSLSCRLGLVGLLAWKPFLHPWALGPTSLVLAPRFLILLAKFLMERWGLGPVATMGDTSKILRY
jgi:hypothetical protein